MNELKPSLGFQGFILSGSTNTQLPHQSLCSQLGFRNQSFEFFVPYVLTVQTVTTSVVLGHIKFIFIFKIKGSIKQNLCSICSISEDSHCLHVTLFTALEHSCGKKYLKSFTHSCMFHKLYCKLIIVTTVNNFVSGEVLVISSI